MLAVVSHDAGGAEVISSFVRRHRPDCLFVLEGPARGIFERKLGPLAILPLDEAIQQGTSLLCGTSWRSDLELRAIASARSCHRRSTAFLDHWTCYPERFSRPGEARLPDEIWVGDRMAEGIARNAFPGLTITLVDNPYFADIRDEFAKRDLVRAADSHGKSVLYVCEPLGEQALLQYGDERYWGYNEEDALRYFLANAGALGSPIERIVIRPHPSEAAAKYHWAQAECSLPVMFGGGSPLIDEIVASDVVIGCESMAMVVALLGGKTVITSIPPGGKTCSLPHPDIISLQSLLKARTP